MDEYDERERDSDRARSEVLVGGIAMSQDDIIFYKEFYQTDSESKHCCTRVYYYSSAKLLY